MITSSLQYLLLVPSYTNVLHVYAVCSSYLCNIFLTFLQFANIHNTPWRSDGDNIQSPSTAFSGSSGIVDGTDVNELYEDALQVLRTKKPKNEVNEVDAGQQEADYHKNFRTTFVTIFFYVGFQALTPNLQYPPCLAPYE